MDYKQAKNQCKLVLTAAILLILFFSCSQREKYNTKDTFYIELINFNDSLKEYISSNTSGKVVFYKNNKLEVISVNFMTDKYPDMHYLKSIEDPKEEIRTDAQKIRIEFIGNYSVDSIKYSMEKYRYTSGVWNKISDLGVLKAFTTYKKAKQFALKEFGNQIINNLAAYSYE